jgi:sigma-B regulation protein RsbU (phosphoserine phosphatase)
MIIKNSGEIFEMKVEGFPICKLGRYFIPYYEDISIQMDSGDKILLYTDGLTDVKSLNGIQYSHNELKDFLEKNHSMNALELNTAITENLFNKLGHEKILDDITFLIMEIH